MTEAATRNPIEEAFEGDTRAEILSFLGDQSWNENLPRERRDDYHLAFDLVAEGPEFTKDWPAARAFIIKMTEGLL